MKKPQAEDLLQLWQRASPSERREFLRWAIADYLRQLGQAHDEAVAIGAGCMRWRTWKDWPASYALQWVWLHPFVRRAGMLRGTWPHLMATFGPFVLEGPFSKAMTASMVAFGTHDRHGLPVAAKENTDSAE